MSEIESIDTKYDNELERTIAFIRELHKAFKNQRHTEVFKRNAFLESQNLTYGKEIKSMVRLVTELKERIKQLENVNN